MSSKKSDSDVAFVKALAELLRANDLSELEVSRDYGGDNTLNVRVARQLNAAPVVAAPLVAAPAIVASPGGAMTPSPAVATPDDPAQNPGAVTSPMVGTAYLQAEPGAPAFITVGDLITEGQTVCIIEAMKTMNQIPAPKSGVVRRILIEDGAPVEFGSPLAIID